MVRLDEVLEICDRLRKLTKRILRVNTNGLADLIHGKETAPLLAGRFDAVSVSLNAPDAQRYASLCHPEFGLEAFPAILHFTSEVKRYVPQVAMSIVDVLSDSDTNRCREIAEKQLGVEFRVRPMG